MYDLPFRYVPSSEPIDLLNVAFEQKSTAQVKKKGKLPANDDR